jgi:hypothetical protein
MASQYKSQKPKMYCCDQYNHDKCQQQLVRIVRDNEVIKAYNKN